MVENRYNLVDEPWIPVVGKGRVGLRQIFADDSISALGGNPIEKIAVFKLLLAIAQSAYTPEDEDDWKKLGCKGLQVKVDTYLTEHYDCFWLYGEKPFLQMPIVKEKALLLKKIEKREASKIGSGNFADIMAENNTLVSENDKKDISSNDAGKALFLICIMNFAFYGKQPNQDIIVSDSLQKKNSIAKPGASLGFNNFLHTFGLLSGVSNSIYFNLLTLSKVDELKWLTGKVGIPYWEKMPVSENDLDSLKSQETLLGRLLPMSRFVCYTNSGIFFTEGFIYHYSKKERKSGLQIIDWIENSISWFYEGSELKTLNASVEKKPWRMLSSLLTLNKSANIYTNIGLNLFLDRVSNAGENFSVWSGGLDVSGDAFGKKIKNTDDYVESEVQLTSSIFDEASAFYSNLLACMDVLEKIFSKILYSSILKYFSDLNMKGDDFTKDAISAFWLDCEKYFQRIVDACQIENTEERKQILEKIEDQIWKCVQRIYDQYCPNQTARQLEAWAKNKPLRKRKA